jgi:molybdenum cofactor guanylyltransferase
MTLALGILAGGRGERCGGRDKGWIEIDGQAQIRRVLDAAGTAFDRRLVSANRHLDDYAALGVQVVPDRWPDHPGPFAGLASLFAQMHEDWLLTIPVDALHLPANFSERMLAARGEETFQVVIAHDAEGLQPLFALYPGSLGAHALETFEIGRRSVREWQHRFPVYPCNFEPIRFGNLNSPEDLPA